MVKREEIERIIDDLETKKDYYLQNRKFDRVVSLIYAIKRLKEIL